MKSTAYLCCYYMILLLMINKGVTVSLSYSVLGVPKWNFTVCVCVSLPTMASLKDSTVWINSSQGWSNYILMYMILGPKRFHVHPQTLLPSTIFPKRVGLQSKLPAH